MDKLNQSLPQNKFFLRPRACGQSDDPHEIRDSFAPSERSGAAGQVFDPNPILTLRDRTLRDKDDAKDAVPDSAYVKVPFLNLYPGDTLDGPYVSTKNTAERAAILAAKSLKIGGDTAARDNSLVYTGRDYELAWKVHIPVRKPPGDWYVYVSAIDGKVLSAENHVWIDKKR